MTAPRTRPRKIPTLLRKACALVLSTLLAFCLAGCGQDVENNAQTETYTVKVELSGGSGRASVQSPCTVEKEGDTWWATVVWSSSNYNKMVVGGEEYVPETTEGGSTFRIPVELDADAPVQAQTTAMSTPHLIDYTLRFDSSTLKPAAEGSAASIQDQPADASAEGTPDPDKFRNADIGCGWQPTGRVELRWARAFTLDEFEGGYRLLCTANGERFLIVPEGAQAPEGLAADIAVVNRPARDVYMVASNSVCLLDVLGAIGNVSVSGVRAEDCSVESYRQAMENGQIAYGGKYNAPDYELLANAGCTLAIENTMVNHSPDVKEKLRALGICVLTDQSSSEPTALGRLEWIKAYGALFGAEDAADSFFDEQAQKVEETAKAQPTGKTVAFFYVNGNGAAVTRRAGDYIAQMIELAGGEGAFASLSEQSASSGGTATLEMEEFFASARDADVIIYNGTVDDSVGSIDDLVAKSPLLAQFKAVKSGQVWCASRNMYQQMTDTADIVAELRSALEGGQADSMEYLRKPA